MATNFGASEIREVSIGRMVSRAFAALRARPGPIFALAFVFAALPNAIVSAFSSGTMPNQTGFAMSGMRTGVFGVVGTLVGFVLSMLAFVGIARVVVAYADGRATDFREAAGAAVRVALPVVGLAILLGLAVGVASIFLLVPGIMLFIMWSAAMPARAVEPIGVFAAFGRSRALTKGARWTIFGYFVILAIVAWVVLIVLGLLVFGVGFRGMATLAQQGVSAGLIVSNLVFSTLASALGGALTTSLYVELRNWKDGPATAALADIFA